MPWKPHYDKKHYFLNFGKQLGWILKGQYTLGNKLQQMMQRQIVSCVLKNFCENLCLSNRILMLQQVAQNQIRQNLCDLLRWENFVAETKISLKIPSFPPGNLLLRRVRQFIAWTVHIEWFVSVTCRLVCPDLNKSTEKLKIQSYLGDLVICTEGWEKLASMDRSCNQLMYVF